MKSNQIVSPPLETVPHPAQLRQTWPNQIERESVLAVSYPRFIKPVCSLQHFSLRVHEILFFLDLNFLLENKIDFKMQSDRCSKELEGIPFKGKQIVCGARATISLRFKILRLDLFILLE